MRTPIVKVHVLQRSQLLAGTPDEVFPFFADAGNLEAITPPFLRFSVVTPAPVEMRFGTFIQYRLRFHRLPVAWHTSIQAWEPPGRFVDVQVRGPFALWHHTHTFTPAPGDEGSTLMTDTVRYAIGFGPLGAVAHRLLVRRDLESIFAFRRRELPRLLQPAPPGTPRTGPSR